MPVKTEREERETLLRRAEKIERESKYISGIAIIVSLLNLYFIFFK